MASPRPLSLGPNGPTTMGWLSAVGPLLAGQWRAEWYGSPFHLMGLGGPKTAGLMSRAHDIRPVDAARGEAILAGDWSFAGETMQVGPGGDPWDRANPSRTFAEVLHGMGWLGDLLATGERGEREALRLVLEWRRIFGRWNSFSWTPEVLERRVFNLACALRRVCERASEAETALLADSLARQARQLLKLPGLARAAERASAAGLAGVTLTGPAGEQLIAKASTRLDILLPQAVLADGGHASRSPQAGLELLADLIALDDGLSQRGRAPPEEMARAIDRLAGALRVLVMPDGRLGSFQGGEAGRADVIAAARAACDLGEPPANPPSALPHTGYFRLSGKLLTVMVDAGAPALGAWSETACGQPLALEVMCGTERLIINCGWSPHARAPQALRLSNAGSTVTVGEASAGAPLSGLMETALGPRLVGGATVVERRLQDGPEGLWLELGHDGWARSYGLRHERLVYLDLRSDELRGEDRLIPLGPAGPGRLLQVAVRFHLAPQVRASLARDGRSVLLQGADGPGWWLRNDAAEVAIEHSVQFEDGEPRRTSQVVLRGQMPNTGGGKIRWKLAMVAP